MVKKIDYQKIEETLDESLRQIYIRNLLNQADLEANLGLGEVKVKDLTPAQKKILIASVIKNLEVDLRTLKKKDPKIFDTLELNKTELNNYFKNPLQITSEEWGGIKKIRLKVDAFKKDLKKTNKTTEDEEIVKTQRKKQKTRRHNTNETWVPLH